MGHALHDISRHNAWATAHLLEVCQGVDEETLNATVPGTFGTVIDTLRHMINSEGSYLFRLNGAFPTYPWHHDKPVGLDLLADRAAILATAWERFLADDVDTETIREGHGDDGEVFDIQAGVFIAQAFHHGNEHRTHVCTILGSRGYEDVDVSVWGYAQAVGRETLRSTPDAD